MMDGHDLRRCVGESMPSGVVFFKDKDGGIHPVESFMRCHTECGTINLFLEDGAMVADFGELTPSKPPKELTDYLNMLYDEQMTKHGSTR